MALSAVTACSSDETLHPWLATGWQISAHRLSCTFTLPSGVKFSDGEKLTAPAVIANLTQIVNPATKCGFAASLIADAINITENEEA